MRSKSKHKPGAAGTTVHMPVYKSAEDFAKKHGIVEFWNGGNAQEPAEIVQKGWQSRGVNETDS